jgi:transcriptional regulator with XRE-family HTH domain
MNYEKLRELIKKENLSQNQMAKNFGMSAPGYKEMLEKKSLKVKNLEKIADYFKVPVSYFFDEYNIEKNKPDHSNKTIPPKYNQNQRICTDPDCITERDKLKDKIIDLLQEINELRKQEGGTPPGKRDVGGMEQTRPTGTNG